VTTWTAVLVLAAVSYSLKAVGPVVAGGRLPGPRVSHMLDLVAVPLLAALILVQTVTTGHALVLDARLPALAVAAVLVWRRAPFLVVVVAAAATAALLRTLG
jgi:branched chain amino acid efflux pump